MKALSQAAFPLLFLLTACAHPGGAGTVDVARACSWKASDFPDYPAMDQAFESGAFKAAPALGVPAAQAWLRVAAYRLSAKPQLFDSDEPIRVVLRPTDAGSWVETAHRDSGPFGSAAYRFLGENASSLHSVSNPELYAPICDFRCPVRYYGPHQDFMVVKVPDQNEYFVFSRLRCEAV